MKMKWMKKATALTLTAMMILSCVGCGGNEENGDKVVADNGGKPVEIAYWHSGMGIEFLENMVKAFNAKQSDWFVYYNATADNNSLKTTFGLEDADTIDLYMGTKAYDTTMMASLDDVLDSTAYGDSKSIKDKFDANYLKYEIAKDGHYYTLPWGGGVVGIVYNKVLFEKTGIKQTPRTTNELTLVAGQLLDAGIVPFTHFRGDELSGYWTYMMDVWAAQYDGVDYYLNNFYGCTDLEGNSPSQDVFTSKDGRYQVMKAMEKFITPQYVQDGANSQDHISAQTLFLKENVGMMVNGSWVTSEMAGTGSTENFGVMKSPVISSITDKLTTVKNDIELRNLISAIDAVTDGTEDITAYQSGDGYMVNGKTVSAADWDRVAEARNLVSANYQQHSCYIPAYSDAIDGAREFLKFFYSDEGCKIYTDALHVSLPLQLSNGELQTDKWESFELEMHNLYHKADAFVNPAIMSKHDVFVNGGATPYAFYNFVELFCANNAKDRVDAETAWTTLCEKIERNYKQWISNIK